MRVGSRGIGRNTVVNLAKRGVDEIFTYKSRRDEADAVVRELQVLGGRVVALPLDTGELRAFDAFAGEVGRVLREWGPEKFEYLVNNAGISFHAPIEKTTEQQFDDVVNVHFKGVFFPTQKLLPLMRDGGRIVNISSGLTRVSVPNSSVYAAAKRAVEVLTRYLAKELGTRRITVNVVASGVIQTYFSGGMVRDNPAVTKMVADMTALGRAGVAEDVGPMIAALLSDENRWVNGQRIEGQAGWRSSSRAGWLGCYFTGLPCPSHHALANFQWI